MPDLIRTARTSQIIGGNLLCVSAMTSTFVMSSEAETSRGGILKEAQRDSSIPLRFTQNDKSPARR
jgi:hypothetical protein